MQRWIVKLDSALPANLVGRKAAALGRLIEAGFPIPSSACITMYAFHTAITKEFDDLCLLNGLLDTVSQLVSTNAPLAVRSSAVQEDLPEASFARSYITHLNVIGTAALERAILDCWRSYLTVSANGNGGGMAVLIQPLVDA